MRVVRRRLVAVAGLALMLAGNQPGSAEASVLPAVVAGTVQVKGAPVAGANVQLVAWPNAATMDRAVPGAQGSVLPIASAITSATGAYALRADLTTVPKAYVAAGGVVNLELEVTAGATSQTWSMSAKAGAQADRVAFDVGAATVSDSQAGGSPTKVAVVHGTVSAGTSPDLGPLDYCAPFTYGSHIYGVPERFAYVYAWTGAPATITETTSSSHHLGIGLSINGGPFTADGSATMTVTNGAYASRTFAANYLVGNKVNYQYLYRKCYAAATVTNRKYLKPVSTYGLLDVVGAVGSQEYWTACDYPTFGTFGKTHGTDFTYGAGVSVGVSGATVNLSAQAGWSSNTEISWTVNSRTRLCGSNELGWASAPTAGAKSYYAPSY